MTYRVLGVLGIAAAVLASVACATFTTSALAQQKQVLKATDVHPLGYPTVEAIVRMGAKLRRPPAVASRSRCSRRCSWAARRR
jgi:hypothetical protein